ncbi:hypothetical protein GOODEAATRI_030513, partial [Goodea atripinnis]
VQRGFRSVLVYLTALDSSSDFLAVGSSIGMLYLSCRRVAQMNKYSVEVRGPFMRFNVVGHHKGSITSLTWSANGMKLFSGDDKGRVVLSALDLDQVAALTVFFCFLRTGRFGACFLPALYSSVSVVSTSWSSWSVPSSRPTARPPQLFSQRGLDSQLE